MLGPLIDHLGVSGSLFLVLLLISMVSGVVQGFAGFGFGIIAMAVLPMLVDLRYATPWVLLVSFLVCAAGVRLFWSDFNWRASRWLIIGGMLGAPIGVILLTNVDPTLLKRLLGLMLLSLPVSEFFNGKVRIPTIAAFRSAFLAGCWGARSICRGRLWSSTPIPSHGLGER